MADKVVAVPGLGNVSFPDSMSDDDIGSAIQTHRQASSTAFPSNLPSGVTKPNINVDYAPPSMFDRIRQAAGVGVNMLTQSPGAVTSQDVSGVPSSGEQFSRGAQNVSTGRSLLGSVQMAGAGLDVASPLVGPAAAENPAATLRALLGGVAGQYTGSGIAKYSGGSPEVQQAAGTAGGVVGGALGAAGPIKRTLAADISEPEAATNIQRAVNPVPTQADRFGDSASKQGVLSALKDYANKAGQTIDTQADLVKAADAVGTQKKALFYDKWLNPIQHEVVEAPAGFQGQTVGEGNRTTIGSLDRRLTVINATLEPKYEAGAALNGEQTIALKNEAGAIRKQLYSVMGQKLGIDPAQIAQVRGDIGALSELSYQSGLSLNKRNFAANAEEQQPLGAAGISKPSVIATVGNRAINAIRGNPADNLISRTFQRLRSSVPITPDINPPTSAPPARTPGWMTNPGTAPRGSHVMEAMRQAGASVDLDNAAMKQALAENPSLQGLGERAQAIKARMQGGSAAEAQAQREWNAGAATRSDEIPTNRPSTEGLTDQQKWNSQAASRFPLPGEK